MIYQNGLGALWCTCGNGIEAAEFAYEINDPDERRAFREGHWGWKCLRCKATIRADQMTTREITTRDQA